MSDEGGDARRRGAWQRCGMAKRSLKKDQPAVELDPDAWPRFEQFIRNAAKAGPKHRSAKKRPVTRRAKRF